MFLIRGWNHSDQRRDPTTVGCVPIPGMYNCLQQLRLGGNIPKPAQSSEAVGHDSEGTVKDRSNGVGLKRNVQGSVAVSAIIRQPDLVGDRWDAQGPDGVPSSSGATDHGDDGSMRGRQRVGAYFHCGNGNLPLRWENLKNSCYPHFWYNIYDNY